MPGGIIGKNLFISIWYSEFSSLEGRMNEKELEAYNSIMEERANIVLDKSIIVKITWGKGETEEITCSISPAI